ncbi:hypothetical protein FHS92_000166 [Sphingobium subterraneum]|uniref:Uncharacterized protein n=1 Tax=Sphingobium subterraneum TaxID=627688 RepID=A0A841IU62_9SPHN|nr:hypothetical protein [Sphingobium subterraneum]
MAFMILAGCAAGTSHHASTGNDEAFGPATNAMSLTESDSANVSRADERNRKYVCEAYAREHNIPTDCQ